MGLVSPDFAVRVPGSKVSRGLESLAGRTGNTDVVVNDIIVPGYQNVVIGNMDLFCLLGSFNCSVTYI